MTCADAPGFTPEDVHIKFHDGQLTVSGERKQESKESKEKEGVLMHHTERTFTRFSR